MGETESMLNYISKLTENQLGKLSEEQLNDYYDALCKIISDPNILEIQKALGNYPEYLYKKVKERL